MMRRLSLRQWAVVFWVMLALAVAANCAHTPPNLSPQAQTAFKADEIVLRLGTLQSTVIEANHAGGLPDRIEVPVIEFVVAAVKTIKETPNGWLPTVKTGLDQLKDKIPSADKPAFAIYLLAIETILAEVK